MSIKPLRVLEDRELHQCVAYSNCTREAFVACLNYYRLAYIILLV